MATLVFFHAHPDDESIATGGSIARYAADGHRVVLVFATRGERGEVDDGFLDAGEELWQRREKEVAASADLLGVARTEFLGYMDSGMDGTPENDDPTCFWQADVDDAAARLVTILDEERADILTIYDENGNYGHPDHIQVHRVGALAGEEASTAKVYEATINRDHIRDLMSHAAELGLGDIPDTPNPEDFTMGMPASVITTNVDIRPFIAKKRASMAAHASQIGETSFFLSMPEFAFEAAFGTEWYILRGAPSGITETDLLEGLAG